MIYLESNKYIHWQPRGIINELINWMWATCQFLLASLQASEREQIIGVVNSEAAFAEDRPTAVCSALRGADRKLLSPSCLCCPLYLLKVLKLPAWTPCHHSHPIHAQQPIFQPCRSLLTAPDLVPGACSAAKGSPEPPPGTSPHSQRNRGWAAPLQPPCKPMGLVPAHELLSSLPEYLILSNCTLALQLGPYRKCPDPVRA